MWSSIPMSCYTGYSADPRLSAAQAEVIRQASPAEPLWVSDISLWEIATLYALSRITLRLPLRDWLNGTGTPAGPASRYHAGGRGSRGGAACLVPS